MTSMSAHSAALSGAASTRLDPAANDKTSKVAFGRALAQKGQAAQQHEAGSQTAGTARQDQPAKREGIENGATTPSRGKRAIADGAHQHQRPIIAGTKDGPATVAWQSEDTPRHGANGSGKANHGDPSQIQSDAPRRAGQYYNGATGQQHSSSTAKMTALDFYKSIKGQVSPRDLVGGEQAYVKAYRAADAAGRISDPLPSGLTPNETGDRSYPTVEHRMADRIIKAFVGNAGRDSLPYMAQSAALAQAVRKDGLIENPPPNLYGGAEVAKRTYEAAMLGLSRPISFTDDGALVKSSDPSLLRAANEVFAKLPADEPVPGVRADSSYAQKPPSAYSDLEKVNALSDLLQLPIPDVRVPGERFRSATFDMPFQFTTDVAIDKGIGKIFKLVSLGSNAVGKFASKEDDLPSSTKSTSGTNAATTVADKADDLKKSRVPTPPPGTASSTVATLQNGLHSASDWLGQSLSKGSEAVAAHLDQGLSNLERHVAQTIAKGAESLESVLAANGPLKPAELTRALDKSGAPLTTQDGRPVFKGQSAGGSDIQVVAKGKNSYVLYDANSPSGGTAQLARNGKSDVFALAKLKGGVNLVKNWKPIDLTGIKDKNVLEARLTEASKTYDEAARPFLTKAGDNAPKGDLVYFYGSPDRVENMTKLNKVRVSPGDPGGQAFQHGPFDRGIYATTIPPYGKTNQAHMAVGFYSAPAAHYANFDKFVAIKVNSKWTQDNRYLSYSDLEKLFPDYQSRFSHFHIKTDDVGGRESALPRSGLSQPPRGLGLKSDTYGSYLPYDVVAYGDTLLPKASIEKAQARARENPPLPPKPAQG